MDELTQKIQTLSGQQIGEAVKNLRLSLQYHWNRKIEDQEARQALQTMAAEGDAESLRGTIISDEKSSAALERWGKSLLLYAATDSELREHVGGAVDDALQSSVKDFGIASLIIIGAVLVLLKWRPKSFQKGEKGVEIQWEDNDVSAVADLARIASGAQE
jgi:hypothetical protein